MRIGPVVVMFVAVAGMACGAWDRTALLETNATPSAFLQAYRLVNGEVTRVPGVAGTRPLVADVSAVPAIEAGICGASLSDTVGGFRPAAAGGGALGLHNLRGAGALAGLDAGSVFGGMPAYESFGTDQAVAREVGGFAVLVGSDGVGTNRVPVFLALAGAANYEIDPFLSLVDVWDVGPLGGMRRTADLMRRRGDKAGYGDAVSEYWRAVNAATERRAVFDGRAKRRKVPAGD